ncbi:MAG: biopolymer transporter ExbD [Pseudomonadota bacterium]
MKRIRRHRRDLQEAADLDVTPFMNLMIVLVPVLLLSMVFTHTTVIELNFPAADGAEGAFDPESVHLEVQVRGDELIVADGRGGTIKALPGKDGLPDFVQLTEVLKAVKRRMPDKEDITILLEEETDYQTLVSVMDRVRSYPTVQGVDVVQAELFPVISLGDTPKAKVSLASPVAPIAPLAPLAQGTGS